MNYIIKFTNIINCYSRDAGNKIKLTSCDIINTDLFSWYYCSQISWL